MSSPLLKTKLLIPPVRTELVQRRRLIQALQRGSEGKLILVSAPAGYGKTTLLSSWAAQCGRPVSWLTLDEGDNDPVRFMAYFNATIHSVTGGDEKSRPRVSLSPALTEEILIDLLNRATEVENAFVLVLDDYHVIQSQAIHDTLSFVLEQLPTQMRMVIASRSELPLPVGRLRGRGELTELRQPDLRFTPEEAREFLNRVMGLSLSPQNVETLAQRTEGWAVGLQMAGLALQNTTSSAGKPSTGKLSELAEQFSGSHHYVMDYLVEEVLQRQAKEVQDFLLRTSILDQMCGALCDRLLDRRDDSLNSQKMLERLENSNLFLTALDERCEWYRYHDLFAEFLVDRLQKDIPEEVPLLHRRAAEWHQQNGSISQAIFHALEAKDYSYAAEMIQEISETLLRRSEVVTLQQWIEALPDEIVKTRPSLCAYHAWALLLAGVPMEVIERRLREATRGSEAGSILAAALQALVATFQGKLYEASALSRLALEELSGDDQFLRSVLSWIISIDTVWGSTNLGEGVEALAKTAEESLQFGNFMIAILSLSNLAEMHMMEGKLGEAQEIYQRALSLALDQAGKRLPIAGMALCGLGELLRRKNLLEDARSYLEEGLLLNKSWGEIGMLDGYVSLALVKQAQGDIEGARMEIGKARNLAQSFDIIELDDLMIDAYQVCLWLVQGNLGAALEWAEQRELSMNGELSGRAWKDQSDFLGNSYLSALEQLALARLLLATGRREDSLTLLKKLFESCQKKGFGWLAFEAQTITAMAFHSLGATEQALDSLQNALSMTVTDKPIRIFLEAGKPMRELLKSYSQLPSTAGDLRSYANRILSAFEVESKMPAHEGQGDSSILEILSPREAEVLRLLAEGFSNQEIAQKMVVASSTVKSHVHHIYNKLGATKRTQAVARARELGLL